MSGRDFIFWNGPVLDMVGHGTHVAGTILEETNNGVGLAGPCIRSVQRHDRRPQRETPPRYARKGRDYTGASRSHEGGVTRVGSTSRVRLAVKERDSRTPKKPAPPGRVGRGIRRLRRLLSWPMEYILSVEVFDRGVRFDSRDDAIVRVGARRLREKFRTYCGTEGTSDLLFLSVGS